MTGFDPTALRTRLAGLRGKAYWQRLEELADTAEFRGFVRQKFPAAAERFAGPNRRGFLRLMAASLALGGVTACGRQNRGETQGSMVPYVHEPTGLVPGQPLDYASSHLLDGTANGILVSTVNGRPIKVGGNRQHPWSRGGTDIFAQASVLGLYDPDRSQAVLQLGRIADWASLHGTLAVQLAALQATHGDGLRMLTGPISSPSLLAQIGALQHAMPKMHWHVHAPASRTNVHAATQDVFGRDLEPHYRFDRAELIVSLDGDFLDPGPRQVGLAERWAEARRAANAAGRLLRLEAVAPTPGLTSAKADRCLPVAPSALPRLAAELLAGLGQNAPSDGGDAAARWRGEMAGALRAARGRSIVLAGAAQPVSVQASAHRINAALGNIGQTVFFTAPPVAEAEDLASLVAAMQQGKVTVLVMLDVNPVYTAPPDLNFAGALRSVAFKLHAGEYADETALHCDWHAPLAHPMESWGDARAPDGTVSLMQPLVEPFYGGRTVPELLSLLTGTLPQTGLSLLQTFWQQGEDPAHFAPRWHAMLEAGFVANSAFPAETVTPTAGVASSPAEPKPSDADLLIRPDPTLYDGRMANVGWLQELPKPLTSTVWENVIAISPEHAGRAGLHNGDIVTVTAPHGTIEGPAWLLPGQAPNTLTAYLGYGRLRAGEVGSGLGYDAFRIRRSDAPWHIPDVKLRNTGQHRTLAETQELNRMEGADLVRVQHLGAPPVGDPTRTEPTLYPKWPSDGHAWGMVIDLDSCIGCHACVVACQAENNIPVVGREEVIRGHDMHWLRVDRYYEGPETAPATRFMPVPCMQCEHAPCELGCPVEATVHDHEGLNVMVYNRCVGTRACSGYCPYKVRRFNFTDYAYEVPPSEQARYNPSVTVRARGVMEKCTYCVQRIATARIRADRENRPIRDGEVTTACQDACPARAIHFGDLADPHSVVHAARNDPRNYALLGELGTRPRTTYLAALAPAKPKEG